ncbi:hypothetical protein FJT64_004397 [Amphibalanus amphitrite]|uniref:Uncharacterized protein n=1 Tax=Amphibalanus amphitrite TaxID=1232801 RepID=A0A6A4W3C3_AMPAM|nr:hypothetical protein FJT64_004397 [Amphibalanus amphitrite]
MEEVNQRLQEYQEAIQKRDDYISRLSSSLQSTIQQRDQLQQSAHQEAQKLAQEITVLQQQLQQTSAFLRDKDFSGINAAEFVTLKNQELRAARAQGEEERRRRAQLETQLESLQQQLRQAQLGRTALEESFGKERAQLTSRVEMYTSQLSDQSSLNESLSVTQSRVSELTSQLEAAARSLDEVTGSAARTEAQLREKLAEQLTAQLEERFGQQLSQITGELRSSHAAELAALRERHQMELSDLRAEHEARLGQLSSKPPAPPPAGDAAELTELRRCREQNRLLVKSLRVQLATATEQRQAAEQRLVRAEAESAALAQQASVAAAARDALTGQLKAVTEEKRVLQQRLEGVSEERGQLDQRTAEEKTALSERLKTVTDERDELSDQLKASTDERSSLSQQLQTAAEELETLRQQLQLVNQLQADTGAQLAEANQQRDQLCRALAATNQQREELSQQLASRDQLSVQLAALGQQQAQLVEAAGRRRASSPDTQDVLQRQETSLTEQLLAVTQQRDSLTQQRDSLTQQLATAELVELAASQAALRDDRAVAKDASNTAIKLRARVETLTRRLEETERRVSDLEQERTMLQQTHQKYIAETAGQLLAAQAEAEKLRACLLVQSVTSPRKDLGVPLTDRTEDAHSPVPGTGRSAAPSVDCVLEAAEAVRAALAASERQQDELLQLEQRVSSELAELQKGLKSVMEQGADTSAAIVLIDASYEVRLLKSKLAACTSINSALHEQLRVHRRVVTGFQRLLLGDASLTDDDPFAGAASGANTGERSSGKKATQPMKSSEDRGLGDSDRREGDTMRGSDGEAHKTEPAGDGNVLEGGEVPAETALRDEDGDVFTEETLLSDLELLERLVRENGTLRRALLLEKGRGQRLLAVGDRLRGRHQRAEIALAEADRRQVLLVDCVQRQQETIERLQRAVVEGGPAPAAPDLTPLLSECGDSLRARVSAKEEGKDGEACGEEAASQPTATLQAVSERLEAVEEDLTRRKLDLDEANQLLQLRDRELERMRANAQSVSGDCDRLRRSNRDLSNRLRRAADTVRRLHGLKWASERLCRRLQADVARSELVVDLERALWEVESRRQLMEHEQRLYQHFLPSLPTTPDPTDTGKVPQRLYQHFLPSLPTTPDPTDTGKNQQRLYQHFLPSLPTTPDPTDTGKVPQRLYQHDLPSLPTTPDPTDTGKVPQRLYQHFLPSLPTTPDPTDTGKVPQRLYQHFLPSLPTTPDPTDTGKIQQRLYQHFLPSLPTTPDPTDTGGGGSADEANREVWLFPTGQSHSDGTPRLPRLHPISGEAAVAPSDDKIDGCADLFTVVEGKLQTEFHNMVQVSAVGPRLRWWWGHDGLGDRAPCGAGRWG